MPRKGPHQVEEGSRGRPGLRFGQRGPQFRDHLVVNGDLNDRAPVLLDLTHELRQPLARFTDGHACHAPSSYDLSPSSSGPGHGPLCTPVYNRVPFSVCHLLSTVTPRLTSLDVCAWCYSQGAY